MRLRAIELEEFRGWVSPRRIELDASVVIVHGPNGTGKTSLFDAVLWALTGEIPRLGDDHKRDVGSLYGESGHTRVSVELQDADGRTFAVTRSSTSGSTSLQLTADDGSYAADEASLELVRRLWPHGGADRATAMASTLVQAVYLQQDDVRRFVVADTDADRFAAVAELVGAGVYGELQRRLESERNSWSRSLTETRSELEKARAHASQLEAQLASLSDKPGSFEGWEEWRLFVSRVTHLNLPVDPTDAASPASVDAAVRGLESAARTTRRRLDQIEHLLEEHRAAALARPPSPDALEEATRLANESALEVETLRAALLDAERAASAARNEQVRLRDRTEELASLAALALRHLRETCPVCEQSYDRARTEAHLRSLLDASQTLGEDAGESQVPDASTRLQAAESKAAERNTELAELRDAANRAKLSRRALISGLQELGMPAVGDVQLALAAEELRVKERLNSIENSRARGEEYSVRLARLAEFRRREQTAHALDTARSALAVLEIDVSKRETASTAATKVIDGLRSAADELVSNRIEALTPLLLRMYSRIDPHPGFQTVEMMSRMWHGRGRLDLRLRDSVAEIESQAPHVVLSSSQLNALALAVFLTFNLGIPRPPLDTVVLDDPLQSLDEINLLGVVDLLRRLKSERQVVVSTHEWGIAELLSRKLRPVGPQESLSMIRLESWERHGPDIEVSTIEAEMQPWRLAHTA